MEIIATVKKPESIVVTITATMSIGDLRKIEASIRVGSEGGPYDHCVSEFRHGLMEVSRKAQEHFRCDTDGEMPF